MDEVTRGLGKVAAGLSGVAGAGSAFLRSSGRTAAMGWRGQLHLSRGHLGWTLVFGDGSSCRVYRESVSTTPRSGDPCLLVVAFKLRLIGLSPVGHAVFRAESLLNTPLFAGFPGFRSKLWLTDAGTGVYRGLYEWDGPAAARSYAATLCRLLRLVSVAGTVRYHVEERLTPGQVLAEPSASARPLGGDDWWRLCSAQPPGATP